MNRFDGKEVKDWAKYVNHRCIVIEDRLFDYYLSAIEVKVLEVSPKGRVKLQFPSLHESWEDSDEYLLIEDLGGKQ